jgi:FdhD protein
MRPSSHVKRSVSRLRSGQWTEQEDHLAAEEPMETRLVWEEDVGRVLRQTIAVTMRTPGDDFQLAAGFLHGEAILKSPDDVVDISYCLDDGDEPQALNIVSVTLRPGLAFDPKRLERNFYTTSSCGVCGKAAMEALEIVGCERLASRVPRVGAAVLRDLPARLREAQETFTWTGGLHAAGLFDRHGRLLGLREDVGRHNALDKLVGSLFMEGRLPVHDGVLLLSGRASFELLQKALVARIPIVASVGAPSSLAVEVAESFNITLVGFLGAEGFNVYTAPERIER